MRTLDELAASAVADVRREAATIAHTDAMLAELQHGNALVATVPTPIKDRGRRRVLVMGAAAAACVAMIAGLTMLGGSDSRVRPVEGGSTDAPVTVPTPSSAPVSKATFAAPVMDITTGSEIVYQFRLQTIDCGQGETCASGLLAPMVTSDNRIVIGDSLRHRWLVATDQGTDTVEFDPSWALLDAAMEPDDTVFAVFVIHDKAVLYRYGGADMDSPQEADQPQELDACCTPSLFLDLGGKGGGGPDAVDYNGGTFVVRRPAGLARPSTTVDDATGDNRVLVEFTDGTKHTYAVGSADRSMLLDGTLHPLTDRAVVVQQSSVGLDAQRTITVLQHSGEYIERTVPLMGSAATNDQRFVDEGYLYELTAVPVVGQAQWFDYTVRRWALPTEASTDPGTTMAPSDTGTATATTSVPAVPGLVTGHSIEGAALGDEADGAVEALTARFGTPASDTTVELTHKVGSHWENDLYATFGNQHAREICWGQPEQQLCVWFGSDGSDPLRLVGWSTTTAQLNQTLIVAANGLAVGSRWSDHLADVTLTGSCYSVGFATTADGMAVELISANEMFNGFDSSGVPITYSPRPDEVTVRSLSAGDQLGDSRSDC